MKERERERERESSKGQHFEDWAPSSDGLVQFLDLRSAPGRDEGAQLRNAKSNKNKQQKHHLSTTGERDTKTAGSQRERETERERERERDPLLGEGQVDDLAVQEDAPQEGRHLRRRLRSSHVHHQHSSPTAPAAAQPAPKELQHTPLLRLMWWWWRL